MNTLKDIRDRLKDELDMVEEQWLDDPDLDRIINSAVQKAGRKIITIYEDYFLSSYSVEISATDNMVDYPPNIYANKMRNMTLIVDGYATEIKPVRNLASSIAYNSLYGSTEGAVARQWLPYDAEDNRKIRLMPDAGTAGRIEMWYIREPKRLVLDTDVCDIPEFVDYVVQESKARYQAIDGDPRYAADKAESLELEKSMIDTLSNMKDDENNEVLVDLSFYEDSI